MKSKTKKALDENKKEYLHYIERLTELSISMFEWKNLPSTIDERFLELTLFGQGMAVFFYEKDIGYLALRTMIGGRLNVYQIPIERNAYASNGFNRKLDDKNSVLIFNNLIHTNSTLVVEEYARKLFEIDRTIEVNAMAQKTPVLITCEEQQRLTMKNLYMQYNGNIPVIYGDKNINPNSIRVLKTDAPYLCDKLYNLKTQIWNEALTYLGISNINVQKKERLIADEIARNMGGVIASRYSRLEARRYACKQINDMFGLDLSVDFRDDFREIDDEFIIQEEGDEKTATPMVVDLRTNAPNMPERRKDKNE